MLGPKAMGTFVHTREGTKMEKRPKTAAPQNQSRVTPAALQGLLEYHSRAFGSTNHITKYGCGD